MNTKFCPKCGKELPQESVFCPYCMTKLIDVKTGDVIKVKKKNYLIPILIILVIAIIVVCAVVFFIFQDKSNSDETNESTITTTESTATETSAVIDDTDYSQYIDIWCDKNSSIDNMTENGGNLLEIISVKNNVIRFTFTKTSSAPENRIARISNVTSEIIDGVGTFTFDNDNWLNSGTGKIKFLDDEIYLETTVLNSEDSNAMWDIGGSFYLTKSDSSIIDFKNYDYLGEDFDEVKNTFGEEIAEVATASDKWDIHTYSGFDVTVLKETNKIVSITVFYSSNQLAKSNLCYGNINGNSTYDDVYTEMVEPIYNNISYGDVTYLVEGNYINFSFDENMNLTGFTLQLENTH